MLHSIVLSSCHHRSVSSFIAWRAPSVASLSRSAQCLILDSSGTMSWIMTMQYITETEYFHIFAVPYLSCVDTPQFHEAGWSTVIFKMLLSSTVFGWLVFQNSDISSGVPKISVKYLQSIRYLWSCSETLPKWLSDLRKLLVIIQPAIFSLVYSFKTGRCGTCALIGVSAGWCFETLGIHPFQKQGGSATCFVVFSR